MDEKRIVALGFFDGVHIGHGSLLGHTLALAKKHGAKASVLTYSRHPSEIVSEKPVKLLNTTDERCSLISELYGIDDIIVREFDREYAGLSCEAFVDKILIKELFAAGVCAGYDFRFGVGGSGDAKTLEKLCCERGLLCEIVPEVRLDGKEVSSSRIRELIMQGKVQEASRLLGHPHCIIQNVTRGRSLGNKLTFPTINQEFCENILIPKYGVYLSRVTVNGEVFKGVSNIGVRPTVSDGERARAETNLLGFSGDLYGKRIKLELISFIREEKKFETLSALQHQIASDVAFAEDKDI